MDKRIGLIWYKVRGFKFSVNIKSITLLELLMALVIMSIMVLSFYSMQSFSSKELVTANRRTKIQNNLTYCLEHMSKYVQQANGNSGRKAIQYYPGPTATGATGFKVYVDFNNPQTPSDPTDDAFVYYTLSTNTLSVGCTGANCPSIAEALSTKIVHNFNNSLLPAVGPTDNTDGFYVVVDPLGNFVDVGLVGRYYPDAAHVPTLQTRSQNPQIAIKTKLICNNSSTN